MAYVTQSLTADAPNAITVPGKHAWMNTTTVPYHGQPWPVSVTRTREEVVREEAWLNWLKGIERRRQARRH